MLFCQDTVFFSQNRIQKVQNTTLVCEIHIVRGYAITLLETLLPPSGDSRPESGTKFSTSPFTSSMPGPIRDGTASRRWIPMPRQKTRCSELFSAVLRKKHRVLAKKHDAPND